MNANITSILVAGLTLLFAQATRAADPNAGSFDPPPIIQVGSSQ